MRLALIYGPKSQRMADTIKTIKDNIDIDCFNDIPEFIDMTLKRNIMYDRLLMPSTFANESTLADLEQFWRSYMYNTSIIMLCKTGEDEEKGKYFKKHFVSTNVCAMFVDSKQKNSTILADAISKPMTYINETYGLNTDLNIEDDEGEVVFMNNQGATSAPVQQAPIQDTSSMQQNQQEFVQNAPINNQVNQAQDFNNQVQNQPVQQIQQPKKERKSLFGRKKKNEVTPNQPNVGQGQLGVNPMQANQQQVQNNVPQSQGNTVQPQNIQVQMQGNMVQPQNNTQVNVPQTQNMQAQTMQQMPVFELKTPDMSTWPTPDSVMPQLGMPSMNTPQMQGQQIQNQQMFNQPMQQSQMGMPNTSYMQQTVAQPNFETQEFQQPIQSEPITPQEPTNYMNTVQMQPQESMTFEQSLQEEIPEIKQEVQEISEVQEPIQVQDIKEEPITNTTENNNIQNVEESINFAESFSDDDFGNVAFGNMANTQQSTPKAEVDEVSEDLGGMNLGVAEQAYRDQNEAPKIITKEVVREIVRDTGGSIVNSILSGKNPHVLIVTGDRGTGITSTCLSIASFFCKKTSVLYFDCDTITHGVLSYINYEEFRNFEPTKMSGTKICKSSKVFSNCVCKFDDNFDIISADYSVDVAKEELTATASVIAEKVVDYGLVIVDCPAENLECISDLLITGNTIVCVDSSKRGFMNMLCALESSPLALRYKKLMVNKGIMFLTKYNKNIDVKRIVDYVKSIYEPEGVDWLAMHNMPFTGKVDTKVLDRVFTK